MVCFLHFLKRLHQEIGEERSRYGAMASYQTDIVNGKNLRDGLRSKASTIIPLFYVSQLRDIEYIRGMLRRAQNCFAISFQAILSHG